MRKQMQTAGFVGVEVVGDVIYARLSADLPEFTATPDGDMSRFSMQWPLRVSDPQRAQWNALHPNAPLDMDLGETRLQYVGDAFSLRIWADLAADMVAKCIAWCRATRKIDEGMWYPAIKHIYRYAFLQHPMPILSAGYNVTRN